MSTFLHRRSVLRTLAAAGAGAFVPARAQDYVATAWPAATPAPALEARDLAGNARTLADYRGRAVVLNFWASWCGPCRNELPTLADLAQFHSSESLAVVAINFKESPRLVRRFLEPRGLDLQVLLDADGANAARWGVKTFPSTFLIDAGGRPRWFVKGEADWTSRETGAMIEPLLPRKTP